MGRVLSARGRVEKFQMLHSCHTVSTIITSEEFIHLISCKRSFAQFVLSGFTF